MRLLILVLVPLVRLCAARTPSFSINDDLLAFPQFDVVFTDGYISEKDAEALLEDRARHPTYSADFSQPTFTDAAAAHDVSGTPAAFSYELMSMASHRYLCSIPLVEAPLPENQTANELAKAEEARELGRAAAKGWELLAQLEDSCLYFMSGWWSYSFCNNREIVQFHALAAAPNGLPPRRDPHTAEFVLGRIPAISASAERSTRRDPKDDASAPVPAELQVKGDQRYLVQRLEGGTVCDLTGRERTVEVQYHCAPNLTKDRIGWIKEVTICAYVMIINTPRLCHDVAFLPPEETRANHIHCQVIADGTPPLLDQAAPVSGADAQTPTTLSAASESNEADKASEVTVGGVVIGARKVLSGADEAGKPPVKLAPPRGFWSGGASSGEGSKVDVLVRAASKNEGGKIKMPSAEELERMDIDPQVVEEMREQMVEMAGDAAWQLEIVQINGGDLRELRGHIDDGDDAGDKGSGAKDKAKTGQDKEHEGSEEKFFKEEL
ncbi:hypothetical protein XA68_16534 [Ophiocordyceps unilateralis]|uniref:Endoplasmic reticulum lectin n=1 Tax=Ophiocordyceps unilateralis TaxID=268505 RepID=A0A2A9P5F4_OPHUN|nr:hypothetical protein XA68_16534 [Ophiocordyceps unilateralis]